MKISLIHPSRGRANKASETLNHWMQMATGKHEIEHILSMDKDDPDVQNYIHLFPVKTLFCLNHNSNVVEATNHAAKMATGDILIYLSDDFKCPIHWDDAIIKRILAQPKLEVLLKVDDALQPFLTKVLTIPIMTSGLYKLLGYFWHPAYRSMFVDEDLYHTCDKLGCMIYAPEIVFPHEHCSIGKSERDETYIRSERNWDHGKELFARRKSEGFPLIGIFNPSNN